MVDTSARVLQLLALLQGQRVWSGSDLAGRLGVSARTLRRDVERLRSLGYPVRSTPGVDGGYQLVAGAKMPPLLLDDDEVVALVVALRAAARTGVSGVAEASLLALSKLRQMIPAPLVNRVEALLGSTVPVNWGDGGHEDERVPMAVLTTLAEACRDTVRVDFGYTSRLGASTERRVEPYRLVNLGHRWYLLAYDPERDDWRTFRVDRMREPRPLRNTFEPRPLPSDDVGAFVRGRLGSAVVSHEVEIVIAHDADLVRRRIGQVGTVEVLDGGRCLLRMATDSFDWLLVMLTSLGAPFTILGPPTLIERAELHVALLRTGSGRCGSE